MNICPKCGGDAEIVCIATLPHDYSGLRNQCVTCSYQWPCVTSEKRLVATERALQRIVEVMGEIAFCPMAVGKLDPLRPPKWCERKITSPPGVLICADAYHRTAQCWKEWAKDEVNRQLAKCGSCKGE
jgi:hypothetical protein